MIPYDLIQKQNERILVLQMLLESLVDELIETKKVKEVKLDERFQSKMEWAQSEIQKAKEEVQTDYLKGNMFGNKMGEA
jgi:hypothetical protein